MKPSIDDFGWADQDPPLDAAPPKRNKRVKGPPDKVSSRDRFLGSHPHRKNTKHVRPPLPDWMRDPTLLPKRPPGR